jgi:nitroreductase|tara:strand:+ start:118 stop:1095 length:978 start_codon:yes stop_codon:yes gene_type:complete
MDIDEIIELCILYQKTNHDSRTSSYDKCRRDLKHILEAVQKDIQHNSTDFITGIANYFWQNQKRMISHYKVELDIYCYILTLLKSKLSSVDFKKADASINVLCKIIEHGPMLKSKQLHARLQDAANHANICQRNWDYSKEVLENDISTLINVATHMPTKQNLNYYELVVSDNREFNKYFYELSYDGIDDDNKWRNSQVNAPLLFIWCLPTRQRKLWGEESHFFDACSISAGAVALSANMLGYRTGFCKCFQSETIIAEMKKRFNLDADRIYVVLGIGNPNNQYKSNEIVRYEGIDYIDNTGYVKEKKNIVKTIQRLIKHITVHRV